MQYLRSIYARLTREFYYRTTGVPSSYGMRGNEFQLHGGYDERSKTVKQSPMLVLARFLEIHELDPELYLDVVFRSWKGTMPPMVNQVMSESALATYRRQEPMLATRISAEKSVYVRTLRTWTTLYREIHHFGPDESVLKALVDPRVELSALFRYCILQQSGKTELAERYLSAAVIEYSPLRKYYDNSWSELIPETLREQALQRRERLGAT